MRVVKTVLGFIVLVLIGVGFVQFYPYIFAKTIEGRIEKVERVQVNVSLMQAGSEGRVNPDLFSFAVAIKTSDGIIHTASAEDRQWAAVQNGICVKAKFFPYPPWKLDKSGTYYGARLLESRVCP